MLKSTLKNQTLTFSIQFTFSYVHFLNERRVEVMKETPDIGFVDISKKMAAEWTALPQEEKARSV